MAALPLAILLLAMSSLTAQNVGIGTTDPQAKLHVAGDGQFDGNLNMNGNSINNAIGLNADNFNFVVPGTLNFSNVASFTWPSFTYFNGVYASEFAASGLVDFSGASSFNWPSIVPFSGLSATGDVDFSQASSITFPAGELVVEALDVPYDVKVGGVLDVNGIVDFSGASLVDLGPYVSINDMNDVNTAGATNSQVLTYNGDQWAPADPPAAPTDLNFNNLTANQDATIDFGNAVNFTWPSYTYFNGLYASELAASGLVDFSGASGFSLPQNVTFDFNNSSINFKYLNGQSGGFADFQSFGSSDVLMPSNLWEVNSSTVRMQTLELNGDFSVNGSVDFSQADAINIDEKISLDDLGSVSAPSPVHGDVLTYDENQGGWVPMAGGGGSNVSFDQLVANQDATVDFSQLSNTAITFPSEMNINSSYIQTFATIETGGSIYANGLTATESVNFANVNDCVLPETFHTPGATNFYVASSEIGTSNNLFVGGNITTTGGLILDGGTVNLSGANIVNLGNHISLDAMNDVNTGGASNNDVLTYNGSSWVPMTSSSDIRFKKDIQPMSNSLSKVLQLRGVEYNWRKEEFPNKHFQDKHQIGFIAQELETVYPDLVNTDVQGYKSVDYEKMGPILVEAIKEQQDIINAQQQELAELKARVEKAEATSAAVSELMSRLEKLESAAAASTNPLTSKE